MVAEKVEAIVRLGMANSRMKDFYDLWLMSRLFEFNGRTLTDAIRNTFKQRSTPLSEPLPIAFTEEFGKEEQKKIQWKAFVRKSKPEKASDNFNSIINGLTAFLKPVLEAARRDDHFELSWSKGGPWN
jgi:hypothetical protein